MSVRLLKKMAVRFLVNFVLKTFVLKVFMTRLGVKIPNHQRPLRVNFQEDWDRRKFLAKLYKINLDKKFKRNRIACDVRDRFENKSLLKDAYNRNQKEKST